MPIPKDKDQAARFDVQTDFERFNQKHDVFNRSWWDKTVRTPKTERFYNTYRQPLKSWRKAAGFTQKDYALRNASWHVTDIFAEMKASEDRREGFLDDFSIFRDGAKEQIDLGNPQAAAAEIKRVARVCGADLAGITAYDERWQYSHKYSPGSDREKPNDIPADCRHVIVLAQAMDYDLIRTVPSALSGTATGLGYSHDAMVLLSVAQFLRNCGYQAVATMNDTALAIPYAIQAGLGEYGRHGLLITPEFGPRVRLGRIYTDLPLAHDRPLQFGVKEFCDICRRCANACPVKAISQHQPSTDRHNISNIQGVKKWSVDGEKCFSYWAAQNSDCSICIRVCPYNKDYSRWHNRIGQKLAGTRLRKLMLWLDKKLGYGERLKPITWWQTPG